MSTTGAAVDLIRYVVGALAGHRLRSVLSALGVAIGVAAVIVLTSVGEGARGYIVDQFTQFGTSLIAVNPGKATTFGVPGVLGGTTHKLTVDDAEALRRLPGVEHVVPVVGGPARVEGGGRGRSVMLYGVGGEAATAWRLEAGQGRFLPDRDPRRGGVECVLGAGLARELFDDASPLGERVRIGGRSFRVVGVMAPKGQLLGFDLDDTGFIPAATALSLFNVDELLEIDVVAESTERIPEVVAGITAVLTERHRGEEDFTVTTQTEMLETFDRVIGIVTVAVSGIAGISLVVGAIGILTIMWISVHERTAEIGLLRALGVERTAVERLFLLESAVLAGVGGALGVAAGLGLLGLVQLAVPGLPVATPPLAVAAAVVMSVVVGIASGVAPARRAAGLDPVEALRTE